MSSDFRIEKDSMGELQVPKNALYGAQTQRAVNNFPVSGLTMPREFIKALGLLKASCAMANEELGLLDQKIASAIVDAAKKVSSGELDEHFPVDVFQTGSGTSSNMNTNEVISHIASVDVHPNDHVNMGQSSNDIIPTAIHVSACLAIHDELLPALEHFSKTLRSKAKQVDGYVKTGRTHLMDAMPVTLGQELNAWATQIENGQARINNALKFLYELAQGGTAVGTAYSQATLTNVAIPGVTVATAVPIPFYNMFSFGAVTAVGIYPASHEFDGRIILGPDSLVAACTTVAAATAAFCGIVWAEYPA